MKSRKKIIFTVTTVILAFILVFACLTLIKSTINKKANGTTDTATDEAVPSSSTNSQSADVEKPSDPTADDNTESEAAALEDEFISAHKIFDGVSQGTYYSFINPFNQYTGDFIKTVAFKKGLAPETIVSVWKFKDINSVDELKEELKKYMSDELIKKYVHEDMLYESNDGLYLIIGAVGTYEYDYSSVRLEGEKDGGYVFSVLPRLNEEVSLDKEYYLLKNVSGQYIIAEELTHADD